MRARFSEGGKALPGRANSLRQAEENLGECARRRHLPMHANEPRGRMNEVRDLDGCHAKRLEKEGGQAGDMIMRTRDQPHIGPGIDVVFHRKEGDGLAAATAELRAVRVSAPANSAQQRTIAGAERDQITATAMIWPQDQSPVSQTVERLGDIISRQIGTVAADRNNFVVTQSRQLLDRIFKSLRETAAALPMGLQPGRGEPGPGTEDVHIGGESARFQKGRRSEQRKSRHGQAAARQIQSRAIGEDQERASRHRSGRHLKIHLFPNVATSAPVSSPSLIRNRMQESKNILSFPSVVEQFPTCSPGRLQVGNLHHRSRLRPRGSAASLALPKP